MDLEQKAIERIKTASEMSLGITNNHLSVHTAVVRIQMYY